MKVYAIISDYQGYDEDVVGIFSTYEKAKEYLIKDLTIFHYTDIKKYLRDINYSFIEWEIDTNKKRKQKFIDKKLPLIKGLLFPSTFFPSGFRLLSYQTEGPLSSKSSNNFLRKRFHKILLDFFLLLCLSFLRKSDLCQVFFYKAAVKPLS